jgi:outer membrane protein OmpA-like peptidoglycan-associated protein
MKSRLTFLGIFIWMTVAVSGQYTKEYKRIFLDAGFLYHAGFYEEALNRYKNLLNLDPGNCNILFHCGACCLQIPGNEAMAVTYLKEASGGVTRSYKDNSHKESGAPVITYFMLGRAYHLNNQFADAIEDYTLYLEKGVDEVSSQLEYARLQIDACRRAEKEISEPPGFEFLSVLDQFNTDLPSCNNPVISGDGNILIFLVDDREDKKIMMTVREDGFWSKPRVINNEIGLVGETYPVCISYDGRDLYLVHQFYTHSDIFVSHFQGRRWSEAEPLGHNVNARTSETHASISKDGNTLYFVSNARGSLGSFDIFMTKRDEKGEWGIPSNLGPMINTPFEERTPFISVNDSVLFFSSQGHTTIGGFDVFYSVLGPDGKWSVPVNLGCPVNTTGEDVFFNPGWGELEGYYAVRKPDDPTSNTINMVIKLEPEPEAEVIVEPEAQLAQEKPGPEPTVQPAPAAAPVTGPASLETGIPFDHNTSELSMAAVLEVEKIADLMLAHPGTTVRLTGHSDATGSHGYNLLLSCQRVEQVAACLEARGIGSGRILKEGLGDTAPMARDKYPDGSDAPLGRYLNRQVIALISNSGSIPSGLSGFYVPESLQLSQGGMKATPDNAILDMEGHAFTIQVYASRVRLDQSGLDIDNIREHACKDNYYRYTVGIYSTYPEAREALAMIREGGHPDAFIQAMEWYREAMK